MLIDDLLGELLGEYHKNETKKTKNIIYYKYIYSGVKTEKYRIFWGVFYEGGGERTKEGVKTCVKHPTMEEDIGTNKQKTVLSD